MAITKPTEAVAYTISEEITAKETRMLRAVTEDPTTGAPITTFGIYIEYESITYELNEEGEKTGIYDRKNLDFFMLPQEQIGALWFEPITLADGTATTMGEHMAKLIDAAIELKMNPPVVEIVVPDPPVVDPVVLPPLEPPPPVG